MEQKSTVLLIENNPDDARLAQLAFERARLEHELVTVEDGAEALGFLERACGVGEELPLPKLILLDLGMPGVSGLELLERLKKEPKLKKIPVAVLSGSSYSIDVRKAFELGAKAFLEKTSDFWKFSAALRKLIEACLDPSH